MGGGPEPGGRGLAKRRGLLDQPAVGQQPQHLAPDSARERVPAEGAAVLARAQHAEHVVAADDCRQGQDPASERLSEHVEVRPHVLVVTREPPAGPAEAGLDLVGHEQDPGLVADRSRGSEVPVGRQDHPGLALDRLD